MNQPTHNRLDRPARRVAYVAKVRAGKAKLAAEALARIEAPPPAAKTVGEVLRAYLADVERRNTSGATDVRSAIECWLEPAFGAMPVGTCDVRHVAALVALMLSSGCAENTVRTKVSFLRSAHAYAHKVGLIERNSLPSFRSVLPPKRPRPGYDPGVLSLEELGKVLASPGTPERERILYAVAGGTGCRVSELIELRVSDIDWDAPELAAVHVDRRWSRKASNVAPPKGGKVRVVPLHPRIAGALSDWLAHGWRRLVGRRPKPDDLLFPEVRPNVHRLNDRRVLKRWHGHLELAGFKRRNFHALRHSFAAALVDVGVEREIIEQFTHPRNARPIDTYLHYTWRRLCAAIQRLDPPPVVLGTQGELFPLEAYRRRATRKADPSKAG